MVYYMGLLVYIADCYDVSEATGTPEQYSRWKSNSMTAFTDTSLQNLLYLFENNNDNKFSLYRVEATAAVC